MSNNKLRTIFSLCTNIAIFALMLTYFIIYAINGFAFKEIKGAVVLCFYTTLSNLFLAIMCLLAIPFNIKSLIKNKYIMPKVVAILKYYATITTTVTFLVVMLYLGPTQGYSKMLEGLNIIVHLVSPILGIVGLISFDLYSEIKIRHTLYSLIPTLAYGVFYIILVKCYGFKDFYGFFASNNYGYTVLIMLGIITIHYIAAILFMILHKKRNGIKIISKKN